MGVAYFIVKWTEKYTIWRYICRERGGKIDTLSLQPLQALGARRRAPLCNLNAEGIILCRYMPEIPHARRVVCAGYVLLCTMAVRKGDARSDVQG